MSFALNVIAKASIILMVAAAASIVLRRASAAARHAVWIFAIVAAVLLPLVAAVVPELQLPVLPESVVSVRLVPATLQAEAALAQHEPKLSPAINVGNGLLVLWGAGMALLLMQIAAATAGVSRLAKSAGPAEDETWAELVETISKSLGCRERVRVLFSNAEVSPMTWGTWRHTILLPSSANHWSAERRRLVLAHELAHVKRNDGILQICLQIACSIYWFNPLIWYAAHRVRTERERACDDQVLNLGEAAEDYADHLVQIARGLQARTSAPFAAVAMAQPSQLETRLVSILDYRTRRRAVSKTAMVFLCACTGLMTFSIASIGVTSAIPLPPVFIVSTKPVPPPETATPPAASQRTHIGNNGVDPSSSVVPPQVIGPIAPLFAAVDGTVTLEASVDVQGNVHVLRVVKGLSAALDQRAIEAVANWQFTPSLRGGLPVASITQIDVDFHLLPQTTEPIRIGPNVKPPTVISRVEPNYTDKARNAKAGGTVVLEAVIRKDGTVDMLRVVHSLGYGLDESAIDALKQWTFRPGTKDGIPVDVALNIEVNFNLR
jgi:TonB family protein